MYTLKATHLQIRGLAVWENIEIFGYENGELYINARKIAEGVDTSTPSLRIRGKFLVFNTEVSTFLYDLQQGSLFDAGGHRVQTPHAIEDEYLCVYDTRIEGGTYQWRAGRYNILTKELVVKYPFLQNVAIAWDIGDEAIIYQKTTGFARISLLTGEYVWRWSLPEGSPVHLRVYGVHEGVLVVSYERTILGLDVQTGEQRWLQQPRGFEPYRIAIQDGRLLALHTAYLNLHEKASCHNFMVELDMSTGEVVREGILPPLDALSADMRSFVWQGDKVYFVASCTSKGAALMGVLDAATLALLWWQEVALADEYVTFREVQIAGDRFYALDQDNTLHMSTLHIFERDASYPLPTPVGKAWVRFEDVPPPPIVPIVDDGDCLPF